MRDSRSAPPYPARPGVLLPLTLATSLLALGARAQQSTTTWTATNYALPPGSGPQALGLYNDDPSSGLGADDLVVANTASNTLSLFSNDGLGGLAAKGIVIVNNTPVAVSGIDGDGDGHRDQLVAVCRDSDTVELLTKSFQTWTAQSTAVPPGLSKPAALGIVIVNSIPAEDLLVACEGDLLNGGGGVYLVVDPFSATPTTIVLAQPAGTASRMVAASGVDLDRDGDLDIVALGLGNPDQLHLWSNEGASSFVHRGTIDLSTSGFAAGLCATELDGAAGTDLAVVLPTLFPTPSQVLDVWTYAGSGPLDPADFRRNAPTPLAGTFGVSVACGDFEDDTIRSGPASFFDPFFDLVVANAGSGTLASQHGFTEGRFTSTNAPPTTGTNPTAVLAFDFNRDGCSDIAVAYQGSDEAAILLTTPPALGQGYGSGCPGTGGRIPMLSGVGLPRLGASYTATVSNAKPFAPALLVLGIAPASMALPGAGCTLLVAPPLLSVLRFTDGAGMASIAFGIPSAARNAGLDFLFQALVFDPNGAFGPGVGALSEGLRLQLGT